MIAFLVGWAFTLIFIYFVVTNFLERVPIPSVTDKPVLITGCDSGFGFDLALKCVGQGMPVFAGCLTEQGKNDLTAKAKTIRDGSRLMDAFLMDVRSQESVEAARDYIKPKLEAYKGLYGLVNNAGIVGNSGVDDLLTPQDYQLAWEVNTLGVIRVTQVFKPFIKKTRGRIVTVSSICARLGLPAIGPYTASKHAVEGYMDVVRRELWDFGVSVSILEPGFFKTPLLNAPRMIEMVERVWQRAPKEVQEEYGPEYLQAAKKRVVEHLERSNEDTGLVVEGYFHALTSMFPRKRYQIGNDSIFFYIPLSTLPTRWQDWILQLIKLIMGAPKPKILQKK